MVITVILLGVACFLLGMYIEKHKWASSAKLGKFIEVNSNIYKVSKVRIELKGDKKDV